MAINKITLHERFWSKTMPQDNGCIVWTASINPYGYGMFNLGGRNINAHRVAFLLSVGDIPFGKELHHVCENRKCVNPNHLQPLTRQEHAKISEKAKESARRSQPAAVAVRDAQRLAKLTCSRGHLFIQHDDRRRCQVCINANQRTRRRAAAASTRAVVSSAVPQ